jgi:DNA-binding response OmpR family regulator
MKILVLDDDFTLGRAIQRALRRDAVVHCEIDPARAIEWVGAVAQTDAQFDLVLCDLRMPTATGFQVAEALRQITACPTFVLMTGLDDIDAPAELVDGVVRKPFTADELKAALAAIVDRTARRRARSATLLSRTPRADLSASAGSAG